MSSVRLSIFVAAFAVFLAGDMARAADLPVPPPMPIPVEDVTQGWYLRGDIGMSQQHVNHISHPSFATAPGFEFIDNGGFDAAPFFGIGAGYQFNDWLRVDVTGEYRGKASFHALDRFLNGSNYNTNDYTASKSEWLFLANAYLDLGTWWRITPFVGAGIGVTQNRINHFRDTNVIAGGGGWADTGTDTDLAWAIHGGLSYKVTPGFTVELAYRYLDLGDAQTAILRNLDPATSSGNPLNPVTFNHITSHDLKVGLRWMCCDSEPRGPRGYVMPAPIYSPPPPAYEPPPPLMRKG